MRPDPEIIANSGCGISTVRPSAVVILNGRPVRTASRRVFVVMVMSIFLGRRLCNSARGQFNSARQHLVSSIQYPASQPARLPLQPATPSLPRAAGRLSFHRSDRRRVRRSLARRRKSRDCSTEADQLRKGAWLPRSFTLSTLNHELSALLDLLLHQFDSLFDHLVSETVDGDVYPVMLFAFHDEIVLETGSIWLVVAGLGDQIDQQIPSTRLSHFAKSPSDRLALCFRDGYAQACLACDQSR